MLFARRLRGTRLGLPPVPRVGWREVRGIFASHREEPRRLALARTGVRGVCRARSGARGAFQSPPASRVSLDSLFPANPPPRSLACSFGGRRLIAIGAPGMSLRGSWRARRRCLPSDRSLPRRSRARGDRRVTFCAALPPGSPGLGSARRQPSRPRETVSVGRDCFVCPLFLRSGRRALADSIHSVQPASTDQTH